MKNKILRVLSSIVIAAVILGFTEITLAGQSVLHAGAAKIDISPQDITGFHNVLGY